MSQTKKTNKKFIIIISVLVVVGGAFGAYQITDSFSHERTDDAQVESNMNPIIPRVSGYIEKVYVTDNQEVKKGDTLFVIDNRDYKVQLEQAKASLAAAESQLEVAKASIGSYQANYATTQANVTTAEGNIETAQVRLWRVQNDFERYKNLYENKSITKQQFEEAQAAKEQAEKQLEVLKSQQVASRSQKNAAANQTAISEKQVLVAEANVETAKARLDAAQLNMDYTIVTSPIDGQLSAVDIQPGQLVQPGQSLFYLVNTSDKWVVANFKETQLSDIKIGQLVEIDVDAFPDHKLEGKVTSFSPATGARFSLLPPDNATGNFVKTVQRLPVKIEFTENNDASDLENLRSGMNVEVDVHLK